ncbi:MAG: prolyl-tRNA synthetase [Proteobacteria bacterium]|nr:prolyl-tRNA synthetase [Pseudomonadota bacterium]
MRLSQLFLKTTRDISKDEVSKNAQLLTKGGYVNQLMAGVYSYLPLGYRVLQKIERIICEEMDAMGGQELLLPALHPKENWLATGRWDGLDVLFKLKGAGDRDLALGATHEEVVTPLGMTVLQSYKDFPKAVYQIQTKFRNEARAKSGLLRGREFRMKDMYSFHTSQDDLDAFYERSIEAYVNVYRRCGLGDVTYLTYASGGTFSKYSHEFQTVTDSGEDLIYIVPGKGRVAINKEIIDDPEALASILPNYQPGDEKKLETAKAIEVGNIFKLGTKYSGAFDFEYTDKDGSRKVPVMGCYGLGPSRLMGTVAEVLSDEHGLVWPEEIAPYKVGLMCLRPGDEACKKAADEAYAALQKAGVEVLYDDSEASAGEKFAQMDLLGLPWQAVVGPKSAAEGKIEWKKRATGEKSVLLAGAWPF